MTDEEKLGRQRPRVTQDPVSWQAGYNAGMSGGPEDCPPEVPDRLAYAAGYVEGKAAPARATAAQRADRGRPGRRGRAE
jgi:hypothetical protein